MRIVAALGGNALLRRGETMSEEQMRANVQVAAKALAPLAKDHHLIITHGNGPQIGIIALQNEAGPEQSRSHLDVLGAQSQGLIGYIIEQEMRNALGSERRIATLLTQVLVDAADAAFAHPSKPIGIHYDEAEAREMESRRGWHMMRYGAQWRRVVASPLPLDIPNIEVIEILASKGIVTICLGGGGVPVVRDPHGALHGVEAVVDKDLASSLLALRIRADALLLLTDVGADYADWDEAKTQPLSQVIAASLDPQAFEAGTMRPKIEAAKSFVLGGNGLCAIGKLEDATMMLAGRAGTLIRR